MDDGQLWDDERKGAPVSHCRAKVAADQAALIERRNRDTADSIGRRPILRLRCAA